MTDPQLLPRNALSGVDVAISVSDSRDLSRLGLMDVHSQLAIAEIARAVLLAGGNITYGGRLLPLGFTKILMDEVRRYGDGRKSLTICVAESGHRDIPIEKLKSIDKSLGTSAQLVLLDAEGNQVRLGSEPSSAGSVSVAETLTAMRQEVTNRTNARVLVGGKLTDYQGDVPGIIEEASMSIAAGLPLYVAGGYGGASAAVANYLGFDDHAWAPSNFPAGADARGVQGGLRELADNWNRSEIRNGLDRSQCRQLAASHRAGDIASLVVLGLSRITYQKRSDRLS